MLSRAAVEHQIRHWSQAPLSRTSNKNYDIDMVDQMINHQDVQEVVAVDEDGGQVFNVYSPVRAFHNGFDEWYRKYKNAVPEKVSSGLACCAEYPASFHYVFEDEIRSIYDVVNNKPRWLRMSQGERHAAWPKGKAVCGYSKAMDSRNGPDPAWKLMLDKFQVRTFGSNS